MGCLLSYVTVARRAVCVAVVRCPMGRGSSGMVGGLVAATEDRSLADAGLGTTDA